MQGDQEKLIKIISMTPNIIKLLQNYNSSEPYIHVYLTVLKQLGKRERKSVSNNSTNISI